MAKQSSRELALERRKALSEAGKKSTSISGKGANRIRTSSDARVTRTNTSFTKVTINPSRSSAHKPDESSYSSASSPSSTIRSHVKPVSKPSRDLVIARREALSQRGKAADTSKDRTRIDVQKSSSKSVDTNSQNLNNRNSSSDDKDLNLSKL